MSEEVELDRDDEGGHKMTRKTGPPRDGELEYLPAVRKRWQTWTNIDASIQVCVCNIVLDISVLILNFFHCCQKKSKWRVPKREDSSLQGRQDNPSGSGLGYLPGKFQPFDRGNKWARESKIPSRCVFATVCLFPTCLLLQVLMKSVWTKYPQWNRFFL